MAPKDPQTAPAATESGESPSKEKNPIQVAEARAEAAEGRARTAEDALGKMEARISLIEERFQEAPAPTPINGEAPVLVPKEDRRRAFACPQSPNKEWLIQGGKVMQIRDPNSPTGYRDHARDGDIKIKFQSGIWFSADPQTANEQILADDKVRIAWCEQHPDIARDVANPMTDVWFEIKKGQIATSRSTPSFSPGIDVDAALAGDVSKLASGGGDVVQRAREQISAV